MYRWSELCKMYRWSEMVKDVQVKGNGARCTSEGKWCKMYRWREMVQNVQVKGNGARYTGEGKSRIAMAKAAFQNKKTLFTAPVHLAPFNFTCTSCTISLHLYILHHFTTPVHLAPERLLPSVSPPITFCCTLHTSQTHIAHLTAPSHTFAFCAPHSLTSTQSYISVI